MANTTDQLIYRLIDRLDHLYMEVDLRDQPKLSEAMAKLREVRTPVRELMSSIDRGQTR